MIRLTFDQELGDSFGVMYYSDFFPVEEGATYRFQCRWRTNGPAAKVFVKAYDVPPSEYRAEPEGRPAAASPTEPYVPSRTIAARSIVRSRISRARRTSGTRRPRISRRGTPATRPAGAA